VYQSALPTGAIQPGSFTVKSGGGSDIEPFESTIQIGPEIHITTDLAGRVVPNRPPGLVFQWTGGDPNAWVTAWFVRHLGYEDRLSFGNRARASTGILGMIAVDNDGYGIGGPVELIVEVTPGEPQAFSARGLSLGGQHLWKYTYRFQGIVLQ
jgi:hypothetical protein